MAYTYTPYQKKDYTESQSVQQAKAALEQQQAAKPSSYQSQWQGQLDDLLQKYQNRGTFQYDVNADAMFQQMLQRYQQQGQQAMMDTMGQAAALTGGYGNSYAQQAGQQSYQSWLQGAYDNLPDYYQMALDRYQTEGDELLNQYSLLSDQEEQAYNRYLDTLSQYNTDLDRLQSAYDSERDYDYNKYLDEQNFDYSAYQNDQDMLYQLDRDAVDDERYAAEWAYQQERDTVADEQWQQEFDEDKRRYDQEWEAEHPTTQTVSSGSSGSSSSGSGSNTNTIQNALASGTSLKDMFNKATGSYDLAEEATKLAQNYGAKVAYQYILANKNADGVTSSDVAKATARVKGVTTTKSK